MHPPCRSKLTTLVAAVLFGWSVSVSAQLRPPVSPGPSTGAISAGNIRGRVVLPSGVAISQAVRVSLLNVRGTREMVFTDNQGQFEFRNVNPGEYTLEVEGDNLRFNISSERVQVFRGAPSVVTVALKEKAVSDKNKAVGNVVSVGELGPDVPDKARTEFERASKLSKDGKALEAIDHLKKAIAIYPNFMMAHNDLGAQLLEQGNLDESAAELRRAIAIDAKAFNPYLNLGIVLIRQKRFAEAADTLGKALSLESDSAAAQLYLGMALMNLNDLAGAERELKTAYNLGGTSYSVALFYLGELYMKSGERSLARQAFEAYVRDEPNAANAAQARKLIGILQR